MGARAAGFVLLATACGGGTTVRSGGAIERPTAPGDVVVLVLVGGGFVPLESAVTTLPVATVLGDGTVITPAATPAIYPGPPVAPLQVVTLTSKEVDDLVAKADHLGLLKGELTYGQPSVADAPTTEVTIVANGARHRHAAYALGMEGFGLSGADVANRKALSAFVDAVGELRPGERAWSPTAIAAYDLGPYTADPQLPQSPAAWPLNQLPPATAATPRPCIVVQGADLAALNAALARANARTPWVVNGVPRSFAFRPVVPGQPACP